MLEIVQAGQSGKTHLLYDMHRLRKRVFKDRLDWEVTISPSGLETDQFDIPSAIYLLSLDDRKRVVGTWRMLPSVGPTMIRDVWPHFLETIDFPAQPNVWEMSRFAVDGLDPQPADNLKTVHRATQELFYGLTELCLAVGIHSIFTMYDARIGRLIRRLNCLPTTSSNRFAIDGSYCQVGEFEIDDEMMRRLRAATGITSSLINHLDLPPNLRNLAMPPIQQVGAVAVAQDKQEAA